ncbi:MAG: hypothetical protein ACOCQY_02870, partial [Halorhabdus sp.]
MRAAFADEPLAFWFDIDPNGTERHVTLLNDAGERISIVVGESTPDPDVDFSRLQARLESTDYAIIDVDNDA